MDATDGLATLRSTSITEYFEDEEKEFTPWLENNLERLEEPNLLNISLEPVGREVSIGKYRADLIAEVPEFDQTVLIENQFGAGDHDHLGKGLVYAAGKDVDILVWIAEQFSEEHISAFRWLNDRTDNEATFFAIEAQLVQIEESPYAIEFEAVERPDEWRQYTDRTSTSKLEQQRRDFWSGFIQYAKDEGLQYVTRSAGNSASYAISGGWDGARIRHAIRFGYGDLEAAIRFTDREQYCGLTQDILENAFREALTALDLSSVTPAIQEALKWDPAEENKTYDHIRVQCDSHISDEESTWAECYHWLVDMTRVYEYVLDKTL